MRPTASSRAVGAGAYLDLVRPDGHEPVRAAAGGRRVELLPEDVGGQNLLAALLRAGRRSLVKITPAHLELLAQQIARRAGGRHRRGAFVIGGENLLAESLGLWRDTAPGTRLINEYGPTETVVGCCVHEVARAAIRARGRHHRAADRQHAALRARSSTCSRCRVGVIGELYIGGRRGARLSRTGPS